MDTIDWLMGALISAFTIITIVTAILLTTYIINPARYESVQHNNHIEIKGDIK